jgi:hypothetical protein
LFISLSGSGHNTAISYSTSQFRSTNTRGEVDRKTTFGQNIQTVKCVPTISVALPEYRHVSSGALRVTNSRWMTFQCPLLRAFSVCLSTAQVAREMNSKTSRRTLRETSVSYRLYNIQISLQIDLCVPSQAKCPVNTH